MGLRVLKVFCFSKAHWDLEYVATSVEVVRCKIKARLAPSVGSTKPQVPKILQRTILLDYTLTEELEVEEALNGYQASECLANSSDYAKYRDEYIRYWHYDDLREAKTKATTIASEEIGQDVLDDDAIHEFWSKVNDDILRKEGPKLW
ncbi:unnamed protein product [Prunus brigantina]